ncbi:MAG: hypothetical protein HY351_02975, partial [Candidatus Omnitrophica bacterium]|nr:hypothetical protein [Candidatus Omnitrophota bacterium]
VPQALKPSAEHAKTISSIRGTELFRELENLEDDLREALPENQTERVLLAKLYHVEVLKSFAKLEIVHKDWETLQPHKPSELLQSHSLSSLNTLFEPHYRFYELAFKRDEALFENMLETMSKEKAQVALVSTGGFHSEGITKKLRAQNVPYILVAPRITQLGDPSIYFNVMQGHRSFMKYFNGSLWDALAQDYAAKLASELNPSELTPSLKRWRDRIIQNSIAEDRITQATSYTKYVDALVQALRKEYEKGSPLGQLSEDQIRKRLERELDSFMSTYFDKLEALLKRRLNLFGAGLKELWKTGDITSQSIGKILDQMNAIKSSNLAVALALINSKAHFDSPQAMTGFAPDLTKTIFPEETQANQTLITELAIKYAQNPALLRAAIATVDVVPDVGAVMADLTRAEVHNPSEAKVILEGALREIANREKANTQAARSEVRSLPQFVGGSRLSEGKFVVTVPQAVYQEMLQEGQRSAPAFRVYKGFENKLVQAPYRTSIKGVSSFNVQTIPVNENGQVYTHFFSGTGMHIVTLPGTGRVSPVAVNVPKKTTNKKARFAGGRSDVFEVAVETDQGYYAKVLFNEIGEPTGPQGAYAHVREAGRIAEGKTLDISPDELPQTEPLWTTRAIEQKTPPVANLVPQPSVTAEHLNVYAPILEYLKSKHPWLSQLTPRYQLSLRAVADTYYRLQLQGKTHDEIIRIMIGVLDTHHQRQKTSTAVTTATPDQILIKSAARTEVRRTDLKPSSQTPFRVAPGVAATKLAIQIANEFDQIGGAVAGLTTLVHRSESRNIKHHPEFGEYDHDETGKRWMADGADFKYVYGPDYVTNFKLSDALKDPQKTPSRMISTLEPINSDMKRFSNQNAVLGFSKSELGVITQNVNVDLQMQGRIQQILDEKFIDDETFVIITHGHFIAGAVPFAKATDETDQFRFDVAVYFPNGQWPEMSNNGKTALDIQYQLWSEDFERVKAVRKETGQYKAKGKVVTLFGHRGRLDLKNFKSAAINPNELFGSPEQFQAYLKQNNLRKVVVITEEPTIAPKLIYEIPLSRLKEGTFSQENEDLYEYMKALSPLVPVHVVGGDMRPPADYMALQQAEEDVQSLLAKRLISGEEAARFNNQIQTNRQSIAVAGNRVDTNKGSFVRAEAREEAQAIQNHQLNLLREQYKNVLRRAIKGKTRYLISTEGNTFGYVYQIDGMPLVEKRLKEEKGWLRFLSQKKIYQKIAEEAKKIVIAHQRLAGLGARSYAYQDRIIQEYVEMLSSAKHPGQGLLWHVTEEEGKRLIDAYFELQRRVLERGIFDPDLGFHNVGVNLLGHLVDFDFDAIETAYPTSLELTALKKTYIEQTDRLPPHLQSYYRETMEDFVRMIDQFFSLSEEKNPIWEGDLKNKVDFGILDWPLPHVNPTPKKEELGPFINLVPSFQAARAEARHIKSRPERKSTKARRLSSSEAQRAELRLPSKEELLDQIQRGDFKAFEQNFESFDEDKLDHLLTLLKELGGEAIIALSTGKPALFPYEYAYQIERIMLKSIEYVPEFQEGRFREVLDVFRTIDQESGSAIKRNRDTFKQDRNLANRLFQRVMAGEDEAVKDAIVHVVSEKHSERDQAAGIIYSLGNPHLFEEFVLGTNTPQRLHQFLIGNTNIPDLMLLTQVLGFLVHIADALGHPVSSSIIQFYRNALFTENQIQRRMAVT